MEYHTFEGNFLFYILWMSFKILNVVLLKSKEKFPIILEEFRNES